MIQISASVIWYSVFFRQNRTYRPYLYQIYGNASKLLGYAIQPDGSLNEITSVGIPYNSPQGLAGF
ncbi:MAG: hypothetical protein ACJ8AG_29970 [Ktedonobacteraceae bacterium]